MTIYDLIGWSAGIFDLIIFFVCRHRIYNLAVAVTTIPYMLPSIAKHVWVNVFMSGAYGLVALYNYIYKKDK